MTLLLDTSILIAIQRKERDILQKLYELNKSHFWLPSISFINYFEFYLGLFDKNIRNKQVMEGYINKFNCLKASSTTALILAELKNKYDKKGISIGLADLIIASQVKENNMVLVTKDRIFEKIEEINKVIL